MDLNHLFSPLELGGHLLPNRIAQGALSSVMHEANAVSAAHLVFYETRARSRPGMIVTESLAAHGAMPPGTRVRVCDEAQLDGLKRWAGVVNRHGVHLIGQFVDPGRGRHHGGRSSVATGASALPDDLSWTMPRVLEIADLQRITDEFATSAERLQRAGFSGVELSCGHGHLLHQFLSPHSNRREDEFGGDVENRTRFIRMIVAAIREACGSGFVIGLKLPGDDGVPGGVSGALAEETLARFASTGQVDYFGIAQGAHHPLSFDMHVPAVHLPRLPYRDITRRMRQVAGGIPVFAVGGVVEPRDGEDLIASGDADAVMMARPFLADPEWVAKARSGAAIRRCIGCNACWEEIIEGRQVSCVVNPKVARPEEVAAPALLRREARPLVVVGAGPAGMEAALAGIWSGRPTTLFSSSPQPGGSLALQARMPGCGRLRAGIDYKLAALREAGASLRLGEAATVEAVMALDPARVVIAAGADMLVPGFAMDASAPVHDLRKAARMLAGQPRRRGTAVIYDQDHTAGTYDAAALIAGLFDRLVIITPRESIARDTNLVARLGIFRRMNTCRAQIAAFSEPVTVAKSSVVIRNVYTGEETRFEDVSLLAYATPRVARLGLARQLRELGAGVVMAGDCDTPGTLMQAVRRGRDAGLVA